MSEFGSHKVGYGVYGPTWSLWTYNSFSGKSSGGANPNAVFLPNGHVFLYSGIMYEPTLPRLIIVKSRLSSNTWSARVRQARLAARTMRAITRRHNRGTSLNQAIAQVVPDARRSWVIHHWPAYCRDGFQALIDARLPREPKLTRACREAVQAARLAKPTLTITEILAILLGLKITPLPSESTLRALFAEVDSRRRYAERKRRSATRTTDLPFAGAELILAAEAETKVMSALTAEIETIGKEILEASQGKSPEQDAGPRDEQGHFTADYNRQRTRAPGQPIASYLRSAEEKAEGQVLSGLRFVAEQPATLERKVRMLIVETMVNTTQGWEGLRAEGVTGVKPLTGFAYMPSTLSKFTSGLARCGAGPRLLEVLGNRSHAVAQERWGESGAMAALYIDNHAKEVWSSLYTMSGKVSHLNRVMPCITSTYVHSGAGTALHVIVQSGSAPLAPRLVKIVEQVEASLDEDIRRAVVIDAEGSTFGVLTTFDEQQRVIVTPLKPSRMPELELRYGPGSYFRPYRERDELRIAKAVLVHKSTNRSIELDALIVRREHRESDTVLLTNGIRLGMAGRDMADLYYQRWPLQENAFKEGKVLGLAEHRGNCGTMVTNIAIVSKLERLEKQAASARETLAQFGEDKKELEQARHDHASASQALANDHSRMLELGTKKDIRLEAYVHELGAYGALRVRAQSCEQTLHRAEAQAAKNEKRHPIMTAKLEKITEEIKKLGPKKMIRQLDVALDTVLTAMKLTTCFLISFVLREYLASMPMTTATFLARVLSTRGRREVNTGEERIVFYENPRDPEVNQVLVEACAHLNKRGLRREGRRLRYEVEAPPRKPP